MVENTGDLSRAQEKKVHWTVLRSKIRLYLEIPCEDKQEVPTSEITEIWCRTHQSTAGCAFQCLPGDAESTSLQEHSSTGPAAHTELDTANREGEELRKDVKSTGFSKIWCLKESATLEEVGKSEAKGYQFLSPPTENKKKNGWFFSFSFPNPRQYSSFLGLIIIMLL